MYPYITKVKHSQMLLLMHFLVYISCHIMLLLGGNTNAL